MKVQRNALVWLVAIATLVLLPFLSFATVPNLAIPRFSENPVNFTTRNTYTVKPGDTLWGLSKKLGISVTQLAAFNDITDPSFLQVGQKIQYQSEGSVAAAFAESKQQDTASASSSNGNTAPQPQARTTSLNAVLGTAQLMYCTLTAYTAGPESTGKRPGQPGYDITSTGRRAIQGQTVAVDPSVIPYGTKLYIPGLGFRVAEDSGGAIIGDHIDIFFNSLRVARQFGVKRHMKVYILPKSFKMPNLQF